MVDLIQDAVNRIDRFMYGYDSEQPAELLADVMHYCREKGYDFAEQLNIAQSYVHEEQSMMEEVHDRT